MKSNDDQPVDRAGEKLAVFVKASTLRAGCRALGVLNCQGLRNACQDLSAK